MSTLAAPQGQPDALATSIEHYDRTEQALHHAADEILASLAEGEGEAIDALGQHARKASTALDGARQKYASAHSALATFEVALRQHHRIAGAAISDYDHAQHAQMMAQHELNEAVQQLQLYRMSPDQQDQIAFAERQVWQARHALDDAERRVADAYERYRRSTDAVEEAAEEAAARLRALVDAGGNALIDFFRDAGEALWDGLVALTEWVEGVLKEVLEAIVTVVTYVLLAIAIVLVVVLALIAFVAIVVVALAVVALALLVLLSAIVGIFAGGIMMIATEEMGIDGAAQIDLVLAAVMAASPLLGSFLMWRIASDVFAPTPEVHALQRQDVGGDPLVALDDLEDDVPQDVADVLRWGGLVDEVGGEQQAVVDVARIDNGGEVTYVVTVPSTMDWVVPTLDASAPNDLDSNLVLMAFPWLRTQYERAVLQAMSDAGIPPGADVIVTGWSQGGIMAASLAESEAGGYNYVGVIAAGAPIDDFALDPDMPVLQVKHILDPVHRLDGTDAVRNHDSHVEVWDGPLADGSPSIKTGNVIGHSNIDYVHTLETHLEATTTGGSNPYDEMFARILPGEAGTYTIDHQQFAFAE